MSTAISLLPNYLMQGSTKYGPPAGCGPWDLFFGKFIRVLFFGVYF